MTQSRYASLQLPVSDASNWVRGGGVFVSADFDLNTPATWTGVVIDPGGDILGASYLGVTAWDAGSTYFHLSPDGCEIGKYLAGGGGSWFDLDDDQYYIRADILVESLPAIPADSVLYLYLSFDEGAGTRYLDGSQSKYDFVNCSTGPSSRDANGVVGSWLNCGGVGGIQSESTTTPNLNITTQNILISFWVNVAASSPDYIIARGVYSTSTAYGWGIYYDGATDQMIFFVNRGSGLTPYTYASGASSITESSTTHCVFIRNGANWYWYINSALAASGSTFGNIITDASRQMLVGTFSTGGTGALAGKLDELRIYYSAAHTFTKEEMKGLYLNPSGAKGGRIIANSLIVGDLPTATGFIIDKTGQWAYATISGQVFQLHALCISTTDIPWQRNTNAYVYPWNASFALNTGDAVWGGYNYRYVSDGSFAGGVFWDQSDRKQYVMGGVVTGSAFWENNQPVGTALSVYGDIAVYYGGDIDFYSSGGSPIASIESWTGGAGLSLSVYSGGWLWTSADNTHIGSTSYYMNITSTGVITFSGSSFSFNNKYVTLGASGSQFMLRIAGIGNYRAYITAD